MDAVAFVLGAVVVLAEKVLGRHKQHARCCVCGVPARYHIEPSTHELRVEASMDLAELRVHKAKEATR